MERNMGEKGKLGKKWLRGGGGKVDVNVGSGGCEVCMVWWS